MNITTRGYGKNSNIVTRGYGRAILEAIYREVIRLTTSFGTVLKQNTSFSIAMRLATGVGSRLRLVSGIGGIMARVRLTTSFNQRLKTSNVVQLGRLLLDNIFKVASRIKLFCSFDLRRRDG
jgi:hypothetical protein